MSIKIVVLPDAGAQNPFQYEMVSYLKKNGYDVVIGKKYKLGTTFKNIKIYQPAILYYDWVHSFIIGKTLLGVAFKSLIFILELIYAKYIRRIKIVHTLHNLQNHAGLWLSLERVVYGFFLKRCNLIRVYSEEIKQEAIAKFNLPANKVLVIQDLPYHFYYPNAINREDARKKLHIANDTFVYLFFGEIKPYKGIDNLIQAYGHVANDTNCLIIAGKGYDKNYYSQLRQMATDIAQIQWHTRFIENDEVQLFFNAADVVVLPFTRIDHSGTIDLAMSFKKPVITLKTPATEKLLLHQTDLLFTEPTQLIACLQKANMIDLEKIGEQNFIVADSTNYKDITTLFS